MEATTWKSEFVGGVWQIWADHEIDDSYIDYHFGELRPAELVTLTRTVWRIFMEIKDGVVFYDEMIIGEWCEGSVLGEDQEDARLLAQF